MAPENDEEDFAKLLAEYEGPETGRSKKKRKEPRVGDEVRGRVISVGRDAAFLDIGAKSDGVIDLLQLRDAAGKVAVQEGDELTAVVVEVGGPSGGVILRRLGSAGPDGKAELEEAFAHGLPVEGMVAAVNKGGLDVTIAGVRAFCPISQLELRHVEDAAAYVGQKLRFRITRLEGSGPRRNLVVSRRALLEEEQAERAAATRAQLQPGAVVKGQVTALKDYGAFVDVGGLEGMLHISELGFTHVGHPKDVLTVGQEIEVQVLRIEKGEERDRIALSLKSLERDPWSDAATRFAEGTHHAGTVRRLEAFGAFVEVAPGVEGLLHISELGRGRPLRHAREATRVGAAVSVIVLGVEVDKRRLSLGLAEVAEGGEVGAAPRAPTSLGTFADLLKGGKRK